MTKDEIRAFLGAALYGDIEAVQKFLDAGFDVNVQNVDGLSALLLAAKEGHTDIIDLLISKGADTSVLNIDGFTVLLRKWHFHIMNLIDKAGLPEQSVGVCYGGAATALFAALRGEAAVKIFMESVNASNTMTAERMKAFEEFILKEPKTDISKHPDFRSYMDTIALLQNFILNHEASEYAHLLPKETELQGQQTETASSALFQPDSKGQIDEMRNTMVVASHGTPAEYKEEELVPLISDIISQCNQTNEPIGLMLEGNNHEISCSYNPKNQKWLLFDMNEQPVYRKIGAEVVCQFIWQSLVTNLTIKADESKQHLIMTPRIITSEYLATKQRLTAHLLEKQKNMLSFSFAGASQETLNKSLTKAVEASNLAPIDLLASSNVSKQTLSTCLFSAIERDKPDIIRILLSHQASMSTRNNQGETPFAYAKNLGSEATCNALIEGAMKTPAWPEFFKELIADGDPSFILHAVKQPGFDPNQPDLRGNTAIHMLASSKLNQNDVMDILTAMKEHADLNPHLKNNLGKTAIDLLPNEPRHQARNKLFKELGMTKFKADVIDKGQHLEHTDRPFLTNYQTTKTHQESIPAGPASPKSKGQHNPTS